MQRTPHAVDRASGRPPIALLASMGYSLPRTDRLARNVSREAFPVAWSGRRKAVSCTRPGEMDMPENAPGAYSRYLLNSWQETDPKRVAALRRAGLLEKAVQEANDRISERISSLLAQGAREYEARELVLPDYAYPPQR